jgi:T4 beta protein
MNRQFYVPILKWKKGEQEALKNLSLNQKTKIMPLIEITDIQDPKQFFDSLNNCFQKPIYIDTLIADEDDREYLLSLIEIVKKNGREAFPVLYFDDLPQNLDLFTPIVNHFAIRIPIPGEIDGPEYNDILEQITDIKNDEIEFDIILDLSTITDGKDATRQYREVCQVLNDYFLGEEFFNSIIISVTSFPESLANLEAGNNISVNRYDFKIFKKILETSALKPILSSLIYSDYGVTKFTDSEIDFKKLRYGTLPKLKYTTEDTYIVLKGKKDHGTRKMVRSYVDLASEVYRSKYYYGENFSFGDYEIKERALGLNKKGPGGATNWVTIVANHHIAVVIEQLSKIL